MTINRRSGIAKFAGFTVDLGTGELRDGQKTLPIQGKPLELLITLLERPGELVTRETLYEQMWRDSSADCQRGLDTAMRKLRKALGDSADSPVYLETLPRRGYRLLTPVEMEQPRPAEFSGHDSFSGRAVPEPKSEADRLYLQGYHCWNKRTPSSQDQALRYFLQARELDPANGMYSAAVAQTYFMLAWHGVERPADAIAEAKSAAVVGILHDSSQLLSHLVLASIRGAFEYDLKGAIQDLRGALTLDPRHAFGHLELCVFLAAAGLSNEAERAIETAHEIDPVSPTIYSARGLIKYLGHRLKEAEEMGRRAVERDPEFGLSRFYHGMELLAMGRSREATQQLALAVGLMPGQTDVRAILAVASALEGDHEQAIRIDEELELMAKTRYVDAYSRALLKDARGMRDDAVRLLEQSYEERSHWFSLAAVDPKLEALRAVPRVQTLLEKIRR